ncbi:hypothetical protein KC685_03440 [Candidatus Dojkabacteria bacterium]|uniref:Uncharacterized protein n=1 Tax=Candidatus Dojkabacteria bacterium TaxID=2099670 RepID=A0A955I0U9_9BACT|nr:hypothetical protein [Candidatus Dojkabacteria bacterium]
MENLIEEYGLVESSFHYDNLYGLPARSLETSMNTGPGLPVIRTDVHGVETIRKEFSDQNLLVIALIPDNWEQIVSAIQGREGGEAVADMIMRRINEDEANIARLVKLANYIIRNTRKEVNGLPELSHTVSLLRMLIGFATDAT